MLAVNTSLPCTVGITGRVYQKCIRNILLHAGVGIIGILYICTYIHVHVKK